MIFKALIFILMMVALTLYFLPTIIAISRKHENALPVFLTNLYLGVTFFGWVIALIWAVSATKPSAVQSGGAIPLYQAQPQAYTASKKFGLLHYVFIVIGALALAVVILFVVAPSVSGVKKTETITIKTGVPVPADQLFNTPAPVNK